MYSVHKTVHPPTGIDNALFCNFLSPRDDNLITFSANKLQVYRIVSSDKTKPNSKTKLEFIESFYLYGNICDIKSCRYGTMKKDALILAFSDAKLSIVEYDSFTGDLATLSIHYFEDELETEGLHLNIFPPILRVDPNMRCAVMLIYGFKLVVIPFYEEYNSNNANSGQSFSNGVNLKLEPQSAKESFSMKIKSNSFQTNPLIKTEPSVNTNQAPEIQNNENKTEKKATSSLSSYTIDLRKLDNWLEIRIIDIDFLYGYYEPTLFILSESNMTWVGRYAIKKDTCNSVALSLNLNQRIHPIIWPVDKLPSDCIKCLAVPPPIGGVLLFAVNSLIYINQSVPSYGITLNSIAKTTTKYPLKSMEETKITLDNSQGVFIASNRLFLSLKGGEIYIITMLTDPESLRTVRSFNIEKGPGSVIASCLVKCNENLLFVGSRLGNSVLLKYDVKTNANKNPITSSKSLKDNDAYDEQSEKAESTDENSQENGKDNEELVTIEAENNKHQLNTDELDYESNDDIFTSSKKLKKSNDPNQLINNNNNNENNEDNQQQFKRDTNNEYDELDQILDTNEEKSITSDIISYNFEICDILLNIAPCGHSIIGESAGDYSEFGFNNLQNHIDLVTSSGYTKNGAISVLQRSLRPEVIASFQIKDVIDMWSVFNDSENSNPTYLFLSKSDSTTILQMGNEITELERETTNFCTKLPTLACASLFNNKYIMQITSNFIYVYSDLINDGETNTSKIMITYDISHFVDSKIKMAFINDEYSGLLTEKGNLIILKLDESAETLIQVEDASYNRENARIDENEEGDRTIMSNLSSINCFYIYKDESDIFSFKKNVKYDFGDKEANNVSMSNDNFNLNESIKNIEDNPNQMNTDDINIDDEEELLYGTSNISSSKNDNINSSYINKLLTDSNINSYGSQVKNDTSTINDANREDQNVNMRENEKESTKSITYWLLTVNQEGNLSMFNLKNNELQLYYTIPKFNIASKMFVLNNQLRPNSSLSLPIYLQHQTSMRNANENSHQPVVHEILMAGLGFEKNRPVLVAKIDEDLIVYEAFLTISNSSSSNIMDNGDLNQTHNNETHGNDTSSLNNIQINFKKINHEIMIRDKRKRKFQAKKTNTNGDFLNGNLGDLNLNEHLTQRTNNTPILRYFSSIGSFNGFFITGVYNYFVFLCPRSGLTAHPFWLDGYVSSFVQLKNTSITLSGFIYFNQNFDIRICSLPIEDGKLQIYYDSPWILKKIQLRQTIHFLCYHNESKTYAVATSILEPTNKLMQLGGEDKELEEFEKDENFILPNKSQFFIQLYTSGWEALPLGKFTLSEWEHITSLKLVSLPYEGHSSGFREYLAASTINCYNEDVNSRGRIIIFDVIETVPEPDKPLTYLKMKTILEKEQKGPVTCIESVNGYLLGGVGSKIFIWEYKNNELIGKAFIDTHFYIHKMTTIKNFVLLADLHRGISLIRFQQDYNKIAFVAKDKQIMDTYTCEYLVDNNNLAFIATDAEKNISVYTYQSESHDNQGGVWLIRKAEFNVGSHINSMFRLKCKVNDPHLDKRSNLADKRQVTYCTNLDGGISYVIPISEKTFRRLFILQNTLFVMKPHYAGLNPKAFRAWQGKRKELTNTQRNILDGDLLFEYFNMGFLERNEIAKKIKTNSDQLLDDLAEIFQLTSHF